MEAMRPAFDPAYQLIMENLPKIGKLRRVTLEYCQYSSRYDKFRQGEILNAFRPELANGAIMDIGVYPIYMLRAVVWNAKDIKSFSTKLENGFEGDGIVLMQYEEMVAEAVYSKITESVNPSVFLGEDGAIVLDHVGVPERSKSVRETGVRKKSHIRQPRREKTDVGIICSLRWRDLHV